MMRTVAAWVGAVVGLVLLTPVIVAAALFWFISAFTRAWARLVEPAYMTRDQLIQFDPVFGWKPRPNLRTHHLMGDLFRISTDVQGWRGRSTLEESDIVVFGDSFAAGYGVSDEQLFADLNSGLHIKPVAIGGYSMVQALLWMEDLAHRLRGKLVVWFVYLGNDLYDNLSPELRGYRKPFVRELRPAGGWEVVSSHVTNQRWPIIVRARKGHIHPATLAELCSDTFLAGRAYGACEYLVRRAQQVCADVRADLVVLTIPDQLQLSRDGHDYLKSLRPELEQFDADLPDRKIASICRAIDVPFVSGKGFLDLNCYKTNDCHWNELGHRKVAAKLAELHASRKSGIAQAADLPSHTTISTRELQPTAKAATST
jgi:hypothetical protein